MSTPLKVGVLLVDTVQLLDLACIDLLYMTTPAYLSACQLPQPLVSLGRPCEIHYIGKQGAGSLHTTTAGLSLILTKSLSDPSVAPGHLDALLIPGPEPAFVPDQADLDFVRAHHEKGTEILSVCTGAYVCGYAGIVDGKSVTGPRALVPSLKRKFPAGKWDDRVRVVRDGRVWSSGLYPFFFFLTYSLFLFL